MVIGSPQCSLGEPCAREVPHVVGLEVDVIHFDEEVRDSAHVFFEAIGALLLSTAVVVVDLPFELCETFAHGFQGSISGGEGDLLSNKGLLVVALHRLEAELNVVGLVNGHLRNFLSE